MTGNTPSDFWLLRVLLMTANQFGRKGEGLRGDGIAVQHPGYLLKPGVTPQLAD